MGGGYSQINAELLLLKLAVRTGTYDRYHLLSGEDLPIQKQEYIHEFFENNHTEYIGYTENETAYRITRKRTRYYYFWQERLGRDKNKKRVLSIINKICLGIQKVVRVNRGADIIYKKGPNWFSITGSLARYVVEYENWIMKNFKNTRCGDEIFLQTLVYNSDYYANVNCINHDNEDALRLIDWKRGRPYIWRKEDINELTDSSLLFARKFNAEIDCVIISEIEKKYGSETATTNL